MEAIHEDSDLFHYGIDIGGSKYHLRVNGWKPEKALYWSTVSNGQLIAQSAFLESPGIPIFDIQDDTGRHVSTSIPLFLLEAIKRFPDVAYQIVQACSYHKYCMELLASSPLTFMCLVQYAIQHELTETDFLAIAQMKKIKQLELMNIPNPKVLLKIERQFSINDIDSVVVDSLLAISNDELMLKEIRHLPAESLSKTVLKFVLPFQEGRLPIKLFRRLASYITLENLYHTIRILSDTVNMSPNLDALNTVRDLTGLRRMHDQLIANMMNQSLHDHTNVLHSTYGEYPRCSLPDTEYLKPITTWRGLVEEGKCMHHCIISYANRIANLSYFVMKMEVPERLTIGFKRQNSKWILDEVRGYRNSSPSEEASSIIQAYVGRYVNHSRSS